MYVVFFLLWIIFNGRITTEIVLFGVAISAALYWFICRFMDHDPKREKIYLEKAGKLIWYLCVLVREIVAANFATMKLVCSSSREIEPVLVRFRVHFEHDVARFLLANSITLTPGTITVSVDGDIYTVHCLDRSLADGIESSIFVELLEKIDA